MEDSSTADKRLEALRAKIDKNGLPDRIHMHHKTYQGFFAHLTILERPTKMFGIEIRINSYVQEGEFICEWPEKSNLTHPLDKYKIDNWWKDYYTFSDKGLSTGIPAHWGAGNNREKYMEWLETIYNVDLSNR